MYDHTRARLRDAFTHYEVSNWARPGQHCRHNLVYWRNQAYLGLGAGAHGSLGGRYANVLRPRRYIHRLADSAAAPAFPFSPAVAQRARHARGRHGRNDDARLRLLRGRRGVRGFRRAPASTCAPSTRANSTRACNGDSRGAERSGALVRRGRAVGE
jgi:hypothetical protein